MQGVLYGFAETVLKEAGGVVDHFASPIEDYHSRQGIDAKKFAQAVGEHERQFPFHLRNEHRHQGFIFIRVHRKKADAGIFRIMPGDFAEARLEFATGRAPRSPEAENQNFSFERSERQRCSVKPAQHKLENIPRVFISIARNCNRRRRRRPIVSRQNFFAQPRLRTMHLLPQIPKIRSHLPAVDFS